MPMQIQSPGPGRPNGLGPKQADGPAASKPVDGAGAQTPEAKTPAQDEIRISGAARELLGATQETLSELGRTEPERLRQILDRIGSGYYDSAEVREDVVGQIADDLGLNPDAT
jgi:hypothetical protein